MSMIFKTFLKTSFLVLAVIAAKKSYSENYEYISIINIIANPEKFNGKQVLLSAYGTLKFENMTICSQKQPFSSKDCIWIEIDPGPYESQDDIKRYKSKERQWAKCNDDILSIRGVFFANPPNSTNLWSGTIKNISQVSGKKCRLSFSK